MGGVSHRLVVRPCTNTSYEPCVPGESVAITTTIGLKDRLFAPAPRYCPVALTYQAHTHAPTTCSHLIFDSHDNVLPLHEIQHLKPAFKISSCRGHLYFRLISSYLIQQDRENVIVPCIRATATRTVALLCGGPTSFPFLERRVRYRYSLATHEGMYTLTRFVIRWSKLQQTGQ